MGKRALFEHAASETEETLDGDPLVGGEHAEGRAALFSAGPRRPGTVVLECSRCGVHTRMSAVEAGVRILMISAWLPPVKRYNRWVQCPECEKRTWCRIHWLG